MFTLSILWKNWNSQSYRFWLSEFFKTWISCFKYAATHWTVSAYFRCLAVTRNPSEQFVALPLVFGTCALCPRQRLLVMPCQNAAVVFRARVQLHITRQLGNQNKESEIIDLYWCVERWHFHVVENHLLNSRESWFSFYHRMLKTPHWYLFFYS